MAGWGRYPMVIAESLQRQGIDVYCLAGKDHADPAIARFCVELKWSGMCKLGGAIRYFRRRGISQATMAGKFHKVILYQPWYLIRHLPDWRAWRTFYPHFISSRKDRRDDTLLSLIVEEFAKDGIKFEPPTNYAPELLVKYGKLTQCGPTPAQCRDIEFGWKLARELGRLDVGQTVAVKGQSALALEAIEGTDACIKRAGSLCRLGGFTVVKVAKPQQDMRFDVPTIGMGTLETMAAAGAHVLAVECGRTVVIDEPEVVEFANRKKIVIVALEPAGQVPQDWLSPGDPVVG